MTCFGQRSAYFENEYVSSITKFILFDIFVKMHIIEHVHFVTPPQEKPQRGGSQARAFGGHAAAVCHRGLRRQWQPRQVEPAVGPAAGGAARCRCGWLSCMAYAVLARCSLLGAEKLPIFSPQTFRWASLLWCRPHVWPGHNSPEGLTQRNVSRRVATLHSSWHWTERTGWFAS